MLSANLVSWRLFLVLIVWICAVVVKSWGADGSPFASKPLSSIDGARAFNSFFGASPYAHDDSIYSAPSKLEEQDILDSTRKGNEPNLEALPDSAPSSSQTHSSLLRTAPALLKSPRNFLDRLTSRRWNQQDTRQARDSAGILPSHISSPPYPPAHAGKTHAQGPRIRAQDDSDFILLSEVGIDSSASESSKQEELSTNDDLLDDTSLSNAVFSSNDLADENTTTDSSPRRFQNPLSMYDLSSGRSKAQGSCFGLVVGMIVAIVWL